MNTKWKIILIFTFLIIFICAVFIFIFISDNKINLKKIVDTEISGIKALVKNIEKENNRFYRNRIKSFVSYNVFPKREKIIAAFARKDRNELLLLSIPYIKLFKQENHYFSTFGWITQDNHFFLRVHNPEVFGDKIDKIRPDIVEVNYNQQPNNGYIVGKRGLEYRLVQPVLYKDKHIGVVQFGIKVSQFLDIINTQLKHPVGVAIPNKIYSMITISPPPSLAGATHTIQSKSLNLFQQDLDKIDWNLNDQRVILQDKAFLIIKAIDLLNYRQESQGYIFVALDISEHEKKLQLGIIHILILSSILILISFLILYFSFSHLIQKIRGLNKALGQSNENLENQVENRTTQLRESEKKLATLLNATSDIAFLVESDGTFLAVNNALAKSLGVEKEELINRSMYEFFSREDAENRKHLLQKVIESKKPFQWKDDRVGKYFDNSVYPIFDDKGNVKQLAVFAKDITEKIKADEILRKYEHIISSTNDHMSFLDRDYTYLVVNNAYLIAHKKESSQITGHTVADILGVDIFEQFVKEKLDCCLIGEEIHYQNWFDFPELGLRYMDVAYYPYTGSDGIISGVVVSSHDITQHKQAEKEILAKQKLNELLLNSMPYPIMLINKKRIVVAANKIALDVGVIIGDYCWKEFGKCECLSESNKILAKNKADDPQIQCTFCMMDEIFKNNKTSNDPAVDAFGRIWDTYWVPLNDNEFLHYAIDITERKQAEEQIATSLNEKVALLREIHHRVKNNMQVIVSLLRMHGRRIKDENLGKVFEDCRDRVDAMSLIHESLYQSDNLAAIDFGVYLRELSQNLNSAYGASDRGIILTVKQSNVILDMDQGIAIGMVITELISNAFKHAFPEGKRGTVEINLSELDENNVQLIVSDNGIGIPPEIDIMNSPSIGLQLAIAAVTRELGGSIEVEQDKGTRFTICFKHKRK